MNHDYDDIGNVLLVSTYLAFKISVCVCDTLFFHHYVLVLSQILMYYHICS
jgi:hypothetical protein